MKKRDDYYIFVVAHSIRGRIRRIHIPHTVVYAALALALIGAVTVLAAVGSYTRMLFKVANYNRLRTEAELLKSKYKSLSTSFTHTEAQLASLQGLASEVSAAYGIRRPAVTQAEALSEDERSLVTQAVANQFQLLLRASYTPLPQRLALLDSSLSVGPLPLDWPLMGRLTDGFGKRLDPFNGEGAFHAGLDISSSYGSPVRAAASGVVLSAIREPGYGLSVTLDHGRGMRTFYAHLSGYNVTAGQAVLAGEIIGFVGRSGRSTGPHLHYEVRVHNAPVNPSRFLTRQVLGSRTMSD